MGSLKMIMANNSKANGEWVQKMALENGNHQLEIIMKVNGI